MTGGTEHDSTIGCDERRYQRDSDYRQFVDEVAAVLGALAGRPVDVPHAA